MDRLLSRRQVLVGAGVGTAGAVLATAIGPAKPAEAALELLVSPRAVYSGIWVPSTSGQYLRLDRNYDQFLAEYGQMWNLNYKLKSLTSYVAGGQVLYSAAYNPNSGGQGLRLGRNESQLVTEYGEMWGQNFRLGNLSTYVYDGQLYYDAVYNPSTAGQYLRLHRNYDQFVATYGEMWGLGFRLTGMVSYNLGGTIYYGGFFHPSTAGQYLRLGRTAADFLTEYGQMWNQNFRLAVLSTHVFNGVVYYNAAYNPGTGGNFIGIDRPAGPFVQTYGDMWAQNFRLASIVTEKVEAISPSRMAQGIRDRLNGNVTGFAATVASAAGRASSTAGLRRTAADTPSRASSATARINIASINKTITSVAVLQLLAARGLTVDSRMSAYLPSDWTRGANISTITFRELLTHTSGIREGSRSTSYADMRTTIANGISTANKTFLYQNQNFALFRVIIPYLNGFSETGVTDKDTATANAYLSYLNQRIFAPSGIATVRAKPEATEPTLSYPFPAGSVRGTDWGDWTKLCGGGCLNMSASELASFLVQLRETTSLLTDAQRTTMLEGLLGWQGRTEVRHGFVNDHGGFLWAPTASNGNIELNTLIASFSSGVHAAVTVNSRVGNGVNVWQSVIDAYHAAWVAT